MIHSFLLPSKNLFLSDLFPKRKESYPYRTNNSVLHMIINLLYKASCILFVLLKYHNFNEIF